MPAMGDGIAQQVREYIVTTFLFGEDDPRLTETASLLQNKFIESSAVLELVAFLEETFAIKVADTELTVENLDSIARIVQFVQRKRGQ
jgi:acyl carrier protein